ncbi:MULTISPECIES: 2-oxoacid:acceptor oxidoreductase family protein [Eubacteriales]|uniref:2-oxoacid:acceptor oxidoreductase family protein n=1 Tax=Bittarella massiliensis (ex Durand et al. 2017) TaxID=1720313 RepID=A0AAQ1RWG4_9FIRM|nr:MULTISPECIES: 2-oxoacid:acceptor oxidoreductase family protein [Eubacteriales]ERI97862.1 putative 2-oxoglutarate ferredoxin oxidoreductase subunit gamma [Clostridium sp. ATCC 29733]MCQ4950065.1 2-oxoacid:acceptor oxidoreductase family protein [Bittarella massiliensis (ex Durand et al. 2017)]MZL68286.1 2-oxoacid:ferredoxin oxidoreductase subunit gamma [Bittarella massiliensis (ex Durand et al. 2017)]MZL79659.1 2-oxoacid:ferredoxin oxidoreductase subunit gamma [Bittarella massiliensis (ex Dura
MTQNILLAGFGGQGILFAGKVAAYSGLMDGKEVSWLPSYGPEMRGGTANCSVCISDDPICSPLILNPDALLVMNKPSYDKFIHKVQPGGVAVIDATLISDREEIEGVKTCYVEATRLAEENDLQGLANIILLGKVLKECGFASLEAVKKGIEKSVPARKQHLVEPNFRAIELGMSL